MLLTDFQAVLFDVDNTINNSKKEVTPETIEAIKQLPPHLHKAVCTGRIFAALEKYIFPYFPADAVHIIAGGAQLVKSTGEILWESCISEETSRTLGTELLDHHIEFLLSAEKKMFATPLMRTKLAQGQVPITLADLADLQSWKTPLISIHHVNPEIREIVGQFPELTVKEMTSFSGNTYFDITAPGVNKASALDKWAEVTGVQLAKTMGFGDSSNDIEFLQKIGFAVAMGNAISEVKSLAKRTIGNSDENGLAVYLRQISQGAAL